MQSAGWLKFCCSGTFIWKQKILRWSKGQFLKLAPLNAPIERIKREIYASWPAAWPFPCPFNPEDQANIDRMRKYLAYIAGDAPRLVKALQAGIPHQVLNARKHDEESKIIARAGAFGAVTIPTNMAGRGVDIKLGGDLDEEILGDVNRVLELWVEAAIT